MQAAKPEDWMVRGVDGQGQLSNLRLGTFLAMGANQIDVTDGVSAPSR